VIKQANILAVSPIKGLSPRCGLGSALSVSCVASASSCKHILMNLQTTSVLGTLYGYDQFELQSLLGGCQGAHFRVVRRLCTLILWREHFAATLLAEFALSFTLHVKHKLLKSWELTRT
jgi:hypothetical protein